MLYIVLARVSEGLYVPVARTDSKKAAGHYAAYYLDQNPDVGQVAVQWFEEFDAGDCTELSLSGSAGFASPADAEEFRRSEE